MDVHDDISLERLEQFFNPTCIFPSQFFAPTADEMSNQKRLLAVILTDAIRCWVKGKKQALEAHRWLFEDYEAPLSFEAVCEFRNLDSDWLRQNLKRWREQGGAIIKREHRHGGAMKVECYEKRRDRERRVLAAGRRRRAPKEDRKPHPWYLKAVPAVSVQAEAILGDYPAVEGGF